MTSSAQRLKQGQSSSILSSSDHRPTLVLCSSKDEHLLSQDICTLCGSVGQSDEGNLIACSQCGQCYHPYCVNIKGLKVVITKGWRCLECTVCETCGQPGDEAKLLLCDECELSCHTYCLNPPLEEVPHGAWKCHWCVVCTSCGTHSPGVNSDWQKNYTECGPCSSRSLCPKCKTDYKQDELIIQCSHCSRWLHGKCDSIRDEDECETAIELAYTCILCRPKDENPAFLRYRKSIETNANHINNNENVESKLSLDNLKQHSSNDFNIKNHNNYHQDNNNFMQHAQKTLLPSIAPLISDNNNSKSFYLNKQLQLDSSRPQSAPLSTSANHNPDIETTKRPASSLLFSPNNSYSHNNESMKFLSLRLDKANSTQQNQSLSMIGELTSADDTVDKSLDDSSDGLMSGCQMIDGVYLSEAGLNFIKLQRLEPLKRQRAKRGPKLQKSDGFAQDDNTKDEDEENKILNDKIEDDGKKKRVRKLSKVGIGGFSVRQRGVRVNKDDDFNFSLNNEHAQTTQITANHVSIKNEGSTTTPNLTNAKPRRIRKKPSKKINLSDQYPSYLQEAFFGKELLDNGDFKLDEKNPDLLNDCSNLDLVHEENSYASDLLRNPAATDNSSNIDQARFESSHQVPNSKLSSGFIPDLNDRRQSSEIMQLQDDDIMEVLTSERDPMIQADNEDSSEPKKSAIDSVLFSNDFNLDMVAQFDGQYVEDILKGLSPQPSSQQKINQMTSGSYDQAHIANQNVQRSGPQVLQHSQANPHHIMHNNVHNMNQEQQHPNLQNQMISPNMSPQVVAPMNQQSVQHQHLVNQSVINQSSSGHQIMPHSKNFVDPKMGMPTHVDPNQHMNQHAQCNPDQNNPIANSASPFLPPSVTLSPRTKMSSPVCISGSHRPPSNASSVGAMSSPAPQGKHMHVQSSHQNQSSMSPVIDADQNNSYQMPPSPWTGPQSDINVQYGTPHSSDQSWQAQNLSDDMDNMTQGKKNLQKWEADEALGEFATTSAVLYANKVHPNLKQQFKSWPERVKHIQKLWRQLPNEKRKEYVEKARENRSQSKSTTKPNVKPFTDASALEDKSMGLERRDNIPVIHSQPAVVQQQGQHIKPSGVYQQMSQPSQQMTPGPSTSYPAELQPHIHPPPTQQHMIQNNQYSQPRQPHFSQQRMPVLANQQYVPANQQQVVRPQISPGQMRPAQVHQQPVSYTQTPPNRPIQPPRYISPNNQMNHEMSPHPQHLGSPMPQQPQQQHPAMHQMHSNQQPQQPRMQSNHMQQYHSHSQYIDSTQQQQQPVMSSQMHQQQFQPSIGGQQQQVVYHGQNPSISARRPSSAYQNQQYVPQQQHQQQQQQYLYHQQHIQQNNYSQQMISSQQLKQDVMMHDKSPIPNEAIMQRPQQGHIVRRPTMQQQAAPSQQTIGQPRNQVPAQPPVHQVQQPINLPQQSQQTAVPTANQQQFNMMQPSLRLDIEDHQPLIEDEDDLKDLGPDFNILEYADPEPDKTSSSGKNNLELDADLETYFDDRDALDVKRLDIDRRPTDAILGMAQQTNVQSAPPQQIMSNQQALNASGYNEPQLQHQTTQQLQPQTQVLPQQQQEQISHPMQHNQYGQQRHYVPQQQRLPVPAGQQFVVRPSPVNNQMRPQMHQQQQMGFQVSPQNRMPIQRYPAQMSNEQNRGSPMQPQQHQMMNQMHPNQQQLQRVQMAPTQQYHHQSQFIDNSQQSQQHYQSPVNQQQQQHQVPQQQTIYHNQQMNVRRPQSGYQAQQNQQHYAYPTQMSSYNQQSQINHQVKMNGDVLLQVKSPIVGEAITSIEFSMYEQGSGRENEAVNFPPMQSIEQQTTPTQNQTVEGNIAQTDQVNHEHPNFHANQTDSESNPENVTSADANRNLNIQLVGPKQQTAANNVQNNRIDDNQQASFKNNIVESTGSKDSMNNSNVVQNAAQSPTIENSSGNINAQSSTSAQSSGSAQNQLLKQLLGNCSSADNPSESSKTPIIVEQTNKTNNITTPTHQLITKPLVSTLGIPTISFQMESSNKMNPAATNINIAQPSNTSVQSPTIIQQTQVTRPSAVPNAPNYEMKTYNIVQPMQPVVNINAAGVARPSPPVGTVQPGAFIQKRHEAQIVPRNSMPLSQQQHSHPQQQVHLQQHHQQAQLKQTSQQTLQQPHQQAVQPSIQTLQQSNQPPHHQPLHHPQHHPHPQHPQQHPQHHSQLHHPHNNAHVHAQQTQHPHQHHAQHHHPQMNVPHQHHAQQLQHSHQPHPQHISHHPHPQHSLQHPQVHPHPHSNAHVHPHAHTQPQPRLQSPRPQLQAPPQPQPQTQPQPQPPQQQPQLLIQTQPPHQQSQLSMNALQHQHAHQQQRQHLQQQQPSYHQEQHSPVLQRTPIPILKKPKVSSNGPPAISNQFSTGSPAPLIMQTPTPPKLSSSDRRKNSLAERRAALEKEPTPPPKEARPKRRPRGPNKRSRTSADGEIENDIMSDGAFAQPTKKRARKSQNKLREGENPDSLLTSMVKSNGDSAMRLAERNGLFACGNLNMPISRLRGSFGNGTPIVDLILNSQRNHSRKFINQNDFQSSNNDGDELYTNGLGSNIIERDCDSPASIVSASSIEDDFLETADLARSVSDSFEPDTSLIYTPDLNEYIVKKAKTQIKKDVSNDENVKGPNKLDINNNDRASSPSIPISVRLPFIKKPLDDVDSPSDESENNKENMVAVSIDTSLIGTCKDSVPITDQNGSSLNMKLKDHGNVSVTLTLTNKEAGGVKRILSSLSRLIDYPIQPSCVLQNSNDSSLRPSEKDSLAEESAKLSQNLESALKLLSGSTKQHDVANTHKDLKFNEQNYVPIIAETKSPEQLLEESSFNVNVDIKPELCCKCKTIVVDRGIHKNMQDIPEQIIQSMLEAAIITPNTGKLVFCSVHCYAGSIATKNKDGGIDSSSTSKQDAVQESKIVPFENFQTQGFSSMLQMMVDDDEPNTSVAADTKHNQSLAILSDKELNLPLPGSRKWIDIRYTRWNPSYFVEYNKSTSPEASYELKDCNNDVSSQSSSAHLTNNGDSSIDSNESDTSSYIGISHSVSACKLSLTDEDDQSPLAQELTTNLDPQIDEEKESTAGRFVSKLCNKKPDKMTPWPEGCEYLQVRPVKRIRQMKTDKGDSNTLQVDCQNETGPDNVVIEYYQDNRRCVLCNEAGDGETDGPARLLNVSCDRWIHLNCALWSLDVYELENGALMHVDLACKKAMTCSLCRMTGATLKCFKTRCPNYYHFKCATKNRCWFHEDKSVLCKHHSKNAESKELHSFVVKRRVYISRDEQKQVAEMVQDESTNVMRVGSLVFLNIGQLLPHQLQAFHTRNHIYPVGYKVIRFYWSYRTFNKRCKYICSIEDKNGKPQFKVVAQEIGLDNEVFLGETPQLAWRIIIERLVKLRKQIGDYITTFQSYIRGDDLFGLNESSVQRILESLPGVENLADYCFKFGRSPLLELPLAINPTGCARTEPKMRIHFKRPYTIRTTGSSGGGLSKTRSLQSTLASAESLSSPYVKQFVHSKSSQYRKMKCEWRNNVVLARSRIQGLGLYAARDIEKHTMIIEYIGMLIRNEIAERYERIHEAHNRGIYMFRLDEDRVIDATLAGGLARYINHSCNPNCVAEAVEIDREKKILIIANRKILKGEELNYDYKLAIEDDQHKISCLCGAPTCKKWMN